MPSSVSSIQNPSVSEAMPGTASRTEARPARTILTVWIEGTSKVHLCVLPLQGWERVTPQQKDLMLDGSVSSKKIKEILREMGWRSQRENLCYVVIPSEDVLLLIQEFPTTDPNEARIMAEGVMQGMVELDQNEHVLLIHELHRGSSSTVCALAIFIRERLQRIFENVQKLGVSNPRFVLDIVGLWQISGEMAENGFWGRVVKDESSPFVVAKALKVVDGVVRVMRQRFYQQNQVDETWITTLTHELFPEEFQGENNHGVTWHISQRSSESPSHLVDFCRLAVEGRLINFEPQPGFWKEHLQRQRRRKIMATAGSLGIGCYIIFLLYLGGFSIWQWQQGKKQSELYQKQEPLYRQALEVKRELLTVQASLNPSGNALEVLRQIVEVMPEEIVIESFNFRFQDSVKLRGTTTQGKFANDFVGELQKNALFKNAVVDSVSESQPGKVNWQINIPFKGVSL